MSKTDAQRLLQRRKPKDSTRYETEIPEEFLCPITQDVMKYPVLCSDGFVYEKGGVISESIFNMVPSSKIRFKFLFLKFLIFNERSVNFERTF
jgi:hypothetical protein